MLASDQEPDDPALSATSTSFMSMRDDVLASWEREVRTQVRGASELLPPVLFNTLPVFYDNIAQALTPSYPRDNATSDTNTASVHGGERARTTSYGPDDVVKEFQLFREAIAAVAPSHVQLRHAEWIVIDASINLAVVQATRAFMATHEELRRRIAAALSHDMRSPLAIIIGGAALVERAADVESARRGAARIKNSAWRLSTMVGELLVALTDRPQSEISMNITRIHIQRLIRAVKEDLDDEGAAKVEIAGDAVIGFWCEANLRRALVNLIGNARKYGDGGKVTVRTRETHGKLLLSVHNTGQRIPLELQPAIFEYLHRGSAPTDTAGWGIGLHFVKCVAQAHGGSVAVDSSDALGTTFIIDIPVDCRPFVA